MMSELIPSEDRALDPFVLVPGNVKAAMAEAGATANDMRVVPPSAIRQIPGFNKRERTPGYLAHIQWLKESMKEHGWKKHCSIPVIIQREGDKEVIYQVGGHSRMEALWLAVAEGAKIDTVTVVPRGKRGLSMADLYIDQVLDNDSLKHTLLEFGNVCYELQNEGLSTTEMAKRLVCSEKHVRDGLDCRALPRAILEMIGNGTVSPHTALDMFRLHGAEAIPLLKGAEAQAKTQGKARVTAKMLGGPRIPPKVSAGVVTAVTTFVDGLADDTRSILERLADGVDQASDDNAQQTVTLPAGLVAELMRAHKEVMKVRLRRAEQLSVEGAADGTAQPEKEEATVCP